VSGTSRRVDHVLDRRDQLLMHGNVPRSERPPNFREAVLFSARLLGVHNRVPARLQTVLTGRAPTERAMPERTIVCPLCGATVRHTSDRSYFTIHRDPNGRPVDMRVMDHRKVRHACPMWYPRVAHSSDGRLAPF